MNIKNSWSPIGISKAPQTWKVHPEITHGEGVPDHLTVHKLVADVPLDQLPGRYKSHLK